MAQPSSDRLWRALPVLRLAQHAPKMNPYRAPLLDPWPRLGYAPPTTPNHPTNKLAAKHESAMFVQTGAFHGNGSKAGVLTIFRHFTRWLRNKPSSKYSVTQILTFLKRRGGEIPSQRDYDDDRNIGAVLTARRTAILFFRKMDLSRDLPTPE